MTVELQAYTTPVLADVTPEEFTAYVARIGKVKDNPERLLRYLIKHKHWSPFEHTYVTFKICTSRSIGRELLRHRSCTFQELSQRYEEVLSYEPVEFRAQSDRNRQSSVDVYGQVACKPYSFSYEVMDEYEGRFEEFFERVGEHLKTGQRLYQEGLEMGIARECMRFILPECTSTTILMTGNLRSWIHFLAVRDHGDAQKEAQEIAKQILNILAANFPVIFKALEHE